MGFQQQFRQLLRILLIVFLAALMLMSISRGWFLLLAADLSRLPALSQDVWRAFYIGLRFDAKVIALAFAPLLLSGLVMAASHRLFCWWRKLLPNYVGLIFFLLTAFSIGNYYYYVTYGNYIDVFAFGLFDDDTHAVLVNAWQDYPILRSFFISVALSQLHWPGWPIRALLG
nr:hypothetical protein [Vibrio navarrensis]